MSACSSVCLFSEIVDAGDVSPMILLIYCFHFRFSYHWLRFDGDSILPNFRLSFGTICSYVIRQATHLHLCHQVGKQFTVISLGRQPICSYVIRQATHLQKCNQQAIHLELCHQLGNSLAVMSLARKFIGSHVIRQATQLARISRVKMVFLRLCLHFFCIVIFDI